MGTTPIHKSFSRNLHMLVNNSSTGFIFGYCGVEAPGNGKDSVDGLKKLKKGLLKCL